jgi:hypothetical protein
LVISGVGDADNPANLNVGLESSAIEIDDT